MNQQPPPPAKLFSLTTLLILPLLFGLAGETQAQTDPEVQIRLPNGGKVIEGGLTAHQVTNHQLLEYRDSLNPGNLTSAPLDISLNRPAGASGASFDLCLFTARASLVRNGTSVGAGNCASISIDQGKTRPTAVIQITGIPNWEKDNPIQDYDLSLQNGMHVANRDFTNVGVIRVVDDDNSAYIGRRRYHPYGGSWNSRPE